jgi:hypothetical protein
MGHGKPTGQASIRGCGGQPQTRGPETEAPQMSLALKVLSDCLDQNGRAVEANRVRREVDRLRQEMDHIKRRVH